MFGVDVGFDDLTAGCREEFLYAVEFARAQHDPATDWEGFRDTLWAYLVRVFGVDDPAVRLVGVPESDDRPGEDPREVAAWLGEDPGSGQRSAITDRPY